MPQRKLSGKRLASAKAATRAVLLHFRGSYVEVARRIGVKRQTVRAWMNRGYVSAPAALALDGFKIPRASKEELRPDVPDWTYVRTYAHVVLSQFTHAYLKL